MSEQVELDLIVKAIAEGFDKLAPAMDGSAKAADNMAESIKDAGEKAKATEGKTKSFADRFKGDMRGLNDVLSVGKFAIQGIGEAIDITRAAADRLGRSDVGDSFDKAEKAAQRLGDTLFTLPIGDLIPALKLFGGETLKGANALDIMEKAASSLSDGLNTLTVIGIQLQAQMGAISWEEAAKQVDDLTGAVNEQVTAEQAAANSTNAYAARMDGLAASLAGSGKAQAALNKYFDELHGEETAARVDAINSSMDTLKITMGGAVDKEMKAFADKQDELRGKMDEAQAKIDELNGKSYLTPAQRQELADTKATLGDLQTAYSDEAAAHEDRTKRIIFDLISTRLAQNELRDGTSEFTADEAKFLDDLAAKWQLNGELTGTVLRGVDKALGDAATSGNWDLAENAVINLQQSLDRKVVPAVDDYKASLNDAEAAMGTAFQKAGDLKGGLDALTDKTIKIDTVYTTTGTPPPLTYNAGSGGGSVHAARGLDMVVPPGYPNDSFPIRVQSGERVIVQTPQQQAQGGQGWGGGLSIGQITIQALPGQDGAALWDSFKHAAAAEVRAMRGAGVNNGN